MSIVLKRWSRDGKPSRLYVNGYVAGGAVWLLEAADDGVSVRASADAGNVDFVPLEGMPPTPTGHSDFAGYSRKVAAIGLSAGIVATLSPAHSAHMVVEIARIVVMGVP